MFDFLSNPIMLVSYLLMIPAAFITIPIHESAHGLMSYKLGDPTARNLGRITMNPMKHFDLVGFLCMVLIGFGWAKPVPLNPRYYKKPRRDMALVAAAGPLSNLALGLVGMLLMYLVYFAFSGTASAFSIIRAGSFMVSLDAITTAGQKILFIVLLFLYQLTTLNIALAVFNMIPIPPFDGSRIAYIFLPTRIYFGIMRYERYILIAVLILLYLGAFSGVISFVTNGILAGIGWLIERIPFFRFA